MATMILDSQLEAQLLAERRASGLDRYDEVWEGVYVMAPMANIEHQRLLAGLTHVFYEVVSEVGLGIILPGTNVSDRVEDWKTNYRIPDLAVFLNSTKATNHQTFWLGGPDFAIEIVSPDDRCHDKLAFYGAVGTGELLMVSRERMALELYRNQASKLELVNTAHASDSLTVSSQVIPLQFRWQLTEQRPGLVVEHQESKKSWLL